MVSPAWTACQRLLEGEVLLAAKQKEVTDRRIVVGAAKNGVRGDAHAARKRDRVGGKPAGSGQAAHDFGLASDERDVDRIARVTVPCQRDPSRLRKKRVTTEIEQP